jgi:hypothetical protein
LNKLKLNQLVTKEIYDIVFKEFNDEFTFEEKPTIISQEKFEQTINEKIPNFNSRLVYLSSWKNILKNVFEDKMPEISELLNKTKIMAFIDGIKGNSKKTVLNAFMKVLSLNGLDSRIFREEFKKIVKESDEERIYKAPTEKQIDIVRCF